MTRGLLDRVYEELELIDTKNEVLSKKFGDYPFGEGILVDKPDYNVGSIEYMYIIPEEMDILEEYEESDCIADIAFRCPLVEAIYYCDTDRASEVKRGIAEWDSANGKWRI